MQHCAGGQARTEQEVAILTRSEDRVQRPSAPADTARSAALRSSPGPKTGCSSVTGPSPSAARQSCDPHPVRRPGAARNSRLCDLGCYRGCDPHPVRRPGAASARTRVHALRHARCDPHPVRRPGAAPHQPADPDPGRELRSSPGPKTGCSPEIDVRIARSVTRLRSSPGPKTGCSVRSAGSG